MPLQNNTFEQIRQVFAEILSLKEPTAKIPSSDLILALVFHFFGQAKDFFSLEAIRRALVSQTHTQIQRSSFSERLNTDKLNFLLSEIFAELTVRFLKLPIRGRSLCKRLQVEDILLLDSSTCMLPDSASAHFKGTSSEASLKYHLCLSLLSGYSPWHDFSEGSSSDQNHFPFFSELKNQLILFDLGYYDFLRFVEIDKKGGFFFSKMKEGCGLKITEIKQGLPLSCLGKKLSELEGAKYSKQDIDAIVEGEKNGEIFRFRVVGFYNNKERRYHFYLTNLKVSVEKLRKLYRLRWQIELFFRSCKQSIGMKKYPTGKLKILVNLVLANQIAQILGMYLFQEGSQEKTEEERLGMSFQRVYLILNLLARDFKEYLLSAFERKPAMSFEDKFALFIPELCDPDKKRKNSLLLLYSLIL